VSGGCRRVLPQALKMSFKGTKAFALPGKVAVITGGTGTLGSCMAKGLAAAGATVVVLGRNREKGEAVVREISEADGKSKFFACDVLVEEALRDVNDSVIEEFGKVCQL